MTVPLTRFQRVLLGTDGTVTNILEAYADEPMEVLKLLQLFESSQDGEAELLMDGNQVLRRRVLLRGKRSGKCFLYAEAVVALDRIQPAILDALFTTDKPIGVLLAEGRVETFREILHVGREQAGEHAEHFDVDPTAELVFRTYRIMAGQRPIILITEKFPAESFRDLPS